MRKIGLALALLFGLANGATAQAPPAVPAFPDSARLTTYSLSASTCACSVGFAIYGSGTDVDEWIQVYINGVAYLSTDVTHGWSLSSVTGSLGAIPRPITNAVLTFNAVQTGTIAIVGNERPRRLSQFSENRGVAARDLNQAVTDQVAVSRELWDKLNRAIVGQPGDVLLPLPSVAARANQTLCFDGLGNPMVCSIGAVLPTNLFSTANLWTAVQTFSGGIAANVSALTNGINIQSQPAGTPGSSQTCVSGATYSALFALNCIGTTNWNINAGTGLVGNFMMTTEVNGGSAQAGNTMFNFISFLDFYADAGVLNRGTYASVAGVARLQASPTATNFYLGGINANVSDKAGIVWPTGSQMIAIEADTTSNVAGLAGRSPIKLVVADIGASNYQGSGFDALIYASTIVGSSAFGFKNFILADATFGKVIGTNGCLICTTGSATVNALIDGSLWAYTSWILKTQTFTINGVGQVVAGPGSGLASIVLNGGGSGAGFGSCVALENASAVISYFGQVGACTGGAFSSNVAVWNALNAALTFGVNNVEQMRLFPSGGLYVGGTPVDPGANNLTVQGKIVNPAATGTPVASLCLDASNNIIKKTTAGSCV